MERLIKEYDETIEKFSRKIYRSHYLYAIGVLEDDVIQIGRIALCKAIERFDEDRGVQFTTFAYEVVKNRIKDYKKFEKRYGKRIVKRKNVVWETTNEKKELSFEEYIQSKQDKDIEDPTAYEGIKNLMIEKMYACIKELPVRQQKIIIYKYGLADNIEKTIQETALNFNLNVNDLEKEEREILAVLRKMMEKNGAA